MKLEDMSDSKRLKVILLIAFFGLCAIFILAGLLNNSKEPEIIEFQVGEESLTAGVELIWEYEPPRLVMILPFEIDFQDEETGDFLGTLEIGNAKNKRVQIFWNGLATSIFFPIKKE